MLFDAVTIASDYMLKLREKFYDNRTENFHMQLQNAKNIRIVAYEKYNNGEMSDYIPTDEDLAKGFATIPSVKL